MSAELLQKLRDLRTKAHGLAATVEDDHASFAQDGKPHCYFRLPSKPLPKTAAPSISPTCTAWMALSAARRFTPKSRATLKAAFIELLSEPWDTGGLRQNNAFTVGVFGRAVAHLKASRLLDQSDIDAELRKVENFEPKYEDGKVIVDKSRAIPMEEPWRHCHDKPITKILMAFLASPEKAMELDPFPASPAIGYWFIDAASHLTPKLKKEELRPFAEWAASEFRRHHSLVASSHQSMMDPVALAMAACMCKVVLKLTDPTASLAEGIATTSFPSDLELEAGIRTFFQFQNPASGVWEKYFPIFQYPASGPNHCWHFEVLEAVIGEFPILLMDQDVIRRLSLSLDWLSRNRLKFRSNEKVFRGWNAGGDVKAMRRGEPESWPTSVAHMFLARLDDQLSVAIRSVVLDKYGRRVLGWSKAASDDTRWKTRKKWDAYLDFNFEKAKECKLDDNRNSVKKLVDAELVAPIEKAGFTTSTPQMKLDERHSAVLFGPPGTAKTTLCKVIARRLGWPFVELSPSDFLGGGLDGIYHKVSEVFEDMLDLYGVVILFDEMDALVQNRAADVAPKKTADPKAETSGANVRQLEVTQMLLTTSMLPKLTELHEDSRSLYFMATNYIDNFDNAIIRSGRFDLLVHIGPPSTEAKISGLTEWCAEEEDATDISNAQKLLTTFLSDAKDKERFGRFTYGETKQFLYALRLKVAAPTISKALLATSKDDLIKEVQEWAKSRITLSDDSYEKTRFEDQKEKTCAQ